MRKFGKAGARSLIQRSGAFAAQLQQVFAMQAGSKFGMSGAAKILIL